MRIHTATGKHLHTVAVARSIDFFSKHLHTCTIKHVHACTDAVNMYIPVQLLSLALLISSDHRTNAATLEAVLPAVRVHTLVHIY